jgi:hypothetical protein
LPCEEVTDELVPPGTRTHHHKLTEVTPSCRQALGEARRWTRPLFSVTIYGEED